MIYYKEFPFEKIKIKTVKKYNKKTKSSETYINMPIAFDTETTSTYTKDGRKFSFVYIWMFGIYSDGKCYITYGRKLEEFVEFINEFIKCYNVTETTNIPTIYVHNLAFDFQFIRKYFNWVQGEGGVFARTERKVIYAKTTNGIKFADSYILSGYSLEKVADNLFHHKIKKLKGDLDYSLCRNCLTPLTKQELQYCNNDIEILLYYIDEQIQEFSNNITKMPITNTQRVGRFLEERCLHSGKNHSKDGYGKRKRYIDKMSELTMSYEEFLQWLDAFMGGFTHANMQHVGKVLSNVKSVDLTSAHPANIVFEKFPMSKPELVTNITYEEFERIIYSDDEGCMFDIELIGLQSKLTYESYITISKCWNVKGVIENNGRVFYAESLETSIVDIDYKIIMEVYDVEHIRVKNFRKYRMSYLPRDLILSVLELYGTKTELKDVEGKEIEYMHGKGMLNSTYGKMVTNPINDEILLNENGWVTNKVNKQGMKEQLQKYNENKRRYLYYPWGVYVPAYTRQALWQVILNVEDDYVYSDTDSVKMLNYEKHSHIIEIINNKIYEKCCKVARELNIDYELYCPKTIEGVKKLIGEWDDDGNYLLFKTLGAKRYLTYGYNKHGELVTSLTCAGLGKKNGLDYLKKISNNDVDKMFKKFTDELYVPAGETGKSTHTYIDIEITDKVTDYLGNTEVVTSPSSCHLEPCEFTLSISKKYAKFLEMVKNGEVVTGYEMDAIY